MKAAGGARKRKVCVDCELEPKKPGHPKWGVDCWLRRQGIEVQVAAARRRLAAVPVDQHRQRVPPEEHPEGRRWCASCQAFRLAQDFTQPGATACRPCASVKAHRPRVERVYDLEQGGYDELLRLQGNRCAICGNQMGQKRFAVDHDHQTGEARGLLCARCNHELLGAAQDSLRIIAAAAYYLRHWPTKGKWTPIMRDDPPEF